MVTRVASKENQANRAGFCTLYRIGYIQTEDITHLASFGGTVRTRKAESSTQGSP